MVVAHRAAGLCDILHAALVGPLDVVAEGEEGVAAQCHVRVLCYPCFLLFPCQHLRLAGEELLPGPVAQHVVVLVFRDIHVDGVVAVGTPYALLEGQAHHLRVLAQPPDVGLVARQSGAVYAALLSGADADGLSVLHVADAVRLRIFQRDERDDEVAPCLGRKGLVLGGDILKQRGVVQLDFVAPLLEGHAEALLALYRLRLVRGVYLDDVVRTLALLLQYLDGLGGIVGGYHAVAHLALQQQGGGLVARVAQRHEVAVARHAVGTAGTGVGTSHGRLVQALDVIDEINLLQRVRQRQSDGGTGRRHVLERGGGAEPCGLFQFFHQLPCVQGVEEIDIARAAVNHFNRQLAFLHEDA